MRTQAGATLLEVLLVVTLLTVLLVGTVRIATPAPARRAATSYLHAVHGQRVTALLTGAPSGVRYDAQTATFERYEGERGCRAPTRDALGVPPGVAVTRTLRDGIEWLPSGSGRSCHGSGVYGGRVRFDDGHEAWDVIVASSGRLRTERAR